MSYVQEMHELLRLQRLSTTTLEHLFEFLAKRSLRALDVSLLTLGVLRANGAIHYPIGFGPTLESMTNDPERVLDLDTPGHAAFLHAKLVQCGSFEDYPFFYPENVKMLFPDGFEISLAVPVPTYGALMIFGRSALILDGEYESFLYSIGETLTLHLDARGYRAQFDEQTHPEEPAALTPLTPRQWAIHEAMLRGLPNGAIAKELSYSESLIRQETMRIYSKMGIRGRKDLPIKRAEGEIT